MGNKTVQLTKESVTDYLDACIGYWRKRHREAGNDTTQVMAECYIDAFQSVRVSLFGETLPEEKAEVLG